MRLPFLAPSGFPDFSAVTPESVREALPRLLAEAEERVAGVERDASPTWDGRVRALADATRPLTFAWHLVEHMLGACNSDAWRALEEAFQPDVVRFSLRVAQSRPLFDAMRALRGSPGFDAMPEGRRRVVETGLRDARDAGVSLEGPARERFVAAATRLSELSTKFSNNVLDATKISIDYRGGAYDGEYEGEGEILNIKYEILNDYPQSYYQGSPKGWKDHRRGC